MVSISDGLLPSRNGLGGFLKFLILKCLNLARVEFKSNQEAEFVAQIVPVIVDSLKSAYPSLSTKTAFIQDVIRHTDRAQKQKLTTSTQIADRYLSKLKNPSRLSGEQIWRLFKGDGSGDEIAIDFIKSYCGGQKKIELDLDGFDRILLKDNEKSLRNQKVTRRDQTAFIELANELKHLPRTDDSFKYKFDINSFHSSPESSNHILMILYFKNYQKYI